MDLPNDLFIMDSKQSVTNHFMHHPLGGWVWTGVHSKGMETLPYPTQGLKHYKYLFYISLITSSKNAIIHKQPFMKLYMYKSYSTFFAQATKINAISNIKQTDNLELSNCLFLSFID